MKQKITCLLIGESYRYTVQRKEHWWNRWHYIYDGSYPRLFELGDLVGLHIITIEELDKYFRNNNLSVTIIKR